MRKRIRVLYVIQGILRTGPGQHLYKLLAYRNRETVEAQVFAFDQCDPAMMASLERSFGVRWQTLGMRFTNPMTYLRGWPRLLKQIDEFRPHVIQTHQTPIVDWVARFATRVRRIPLNIGRPASQPRQYHMTRRGVWAWRFTHLGDRLTNPLVDYYLPNSQGVSDYMHEVEGVPRSKIIVVPNGVDTTYFSYTEALREEGRQVLKLEAADRLIATIGHLIPLKGQHRLVEAAQELMMDFPNLRIALVGKTWSVADELYVQDLKQRISATEQAERFIFTGELDDVRPILAAADLYAHPSYSEGSPNAVLEAMAMGRACVVTDISGCKELIVDGEGGLVVPPHDSKQLAHAIRRVMSDDVLREHMGMTSRRRAIEHYSVQRMCSTIEAIYRRALGEKGIHLSK